MAALHRNGGQPRRVVVTGLGVVSPLGNDVPTLWQALRAGESGIGPITRFDTSDYATHFAGEVKGFDPEKYMERKEVRHSDRFVQYAMAAAAQAVEQAGLDPAKGDPYRIGLVVGSGIGGIETLESQHRTMMEKGPGRISPFFIPMMISNMSTGALAIKMGFKGPSFTPVSACSTGAHAIGEGFRMLQRNQVDAVVAGGTEAPITPMSLAGFGNMKALSTRNESPETASRPFDATRDGFVLGEGSATLVLESLAHAHARGAPILAELIGFGQSADAYHLTAPAPEGVGAQLAMRHALADAGVRPEGVQYINAHGTSTPMNDLNETLAVKAVFGEAARQLVVGSTKSMTGHLLGAAGALEAAICALVVREGRIPPTINFTTPDPACDLDYAHNRLIERDVEVALSNSFGFGGHNVTLAIARWRE